MSPVCDGDDGDGDGVGIDDINVDVDVDENVDVAVQEALAQCTDTPPDEEEDSGFGNWNDDAGEAAFEKQHPGMSTHSTIAWEDTDAWTKANKVDQIFNLPFEPDFVDPTNHCCATKEHSFGSENSGTERRIHRCVKCLVKCQECGHGAIPGLIVPKCKSCPLAIPVIPKKCSCGSVLSPIEFILSSNE